MNFEDESFYQDAIKIFRDAGYTVTDTPIFSNHSYKDIVYFDGTKMLMLDNLTATTLKIATNISHLFDLDDEFFEEGTGSRIAYYSVVLECNKLSRSQSAHDIHELFHSTFKADISILLFKNASSFLISIAGVENDIMLSDWFDCLLDTEEISNRIDILEIST
ncbi:hypothetical protein [Eubacterium aggregans]|uniref:hypothetical protein n=1 Tax=Eubacterium aggregans TaxID=81409 RepID=UPI003F413087